MLVESYQIGGMGIDMQLIKNIGIAIIILLATWILANMAKWAAAKMVDNIGFLQKTNTEGESIGMSIGKIVSLLVWLFGIVGILQVMNLEGVIRPLENMLSQITGYLPNILGAGIFFFFGLIVARIARQILETFLATVNLDGWIAKAKAMDMDGDGETGEAPVETINANALGKTLANALFALIMIVVSISALTALKIEAISAPAISILESLAFAIPKIFGACLILAIVYFIARWIGGLIRDIMKNMGADAAVSALGILPGNVKLSSAVSNIVKTIIILFGAIAATRILAFPELTEILNQILELGGRVIFGSIVIGAGILLANFISNIIAKSTGEKGLVVSMLRFLIIAVATFMGLTFMEIGEQIVIIAFSGFVFAAAVATALAFGLGGREAAARQLKKMQDEADKK